MNSPLIDDRLDRHQASRDQGRPTVSVLAGPDGFATDAARRWAQGRGRSVVVVVKPGLDAMIDAMVEAFLARMDSPADLAIERLASRLNQPANALRSRIARMTPIERNLFLDASPTDSSPSAEAACRHLLEQAAARRPVDAQSLGRAIAVGPGDSPSERAWVAIGDLVPPATGPILVVAADLDEPSYTWFDQAVRSIARLATLQPRLPVVLSVCGDSLETYFRLAPESREKAMIRSGVIEIPGPVSNWNPPSPSPGRDDEARSEAERYLFDRLEAMPSTTGLFAMNVMLDIPFGPGRMMEGDLVCRALGLVIEVDGYYHFTDADAYRRDRRKDFLLQTHGYLVIRVLADDVVARLEEILDVVVTAVKHRQNSSDARPRDITP